MATLFDEFCFAKLATNPAGYIHLAFKTKGYGSWEIFARKKEPALVTGFKEIGFQTSTRTCFYFINQLMASWRENSEANFPVSATQNLKQSMNSGWFPAYFKQPKKHRLCCSWILAGQSTGRKRLD